jgi:hypothetical protein
MKGIKNGNGMEVRRQDGETIHQGTEKYLIAQRKINKKKRTR